MTQTGVAGYVAGFPIPEVLQGINAFTLGMRSVNPKAQVRVLWINTWFDPGKEADAAKVLLSQGVDVLSQHTDSTAPLQIAEEQGKVGFGLNAATGVYEDLLHAGVADPVKVTRSALQNAASIAALFLTTEAVVADKPEKAAPMPGGDGGMGRMDF